MYDKLHSILANPSGEIKLMENEWTKVVKEAEAKFIDAAEHLESYNNYFGASQSFGSLQMPKINPCDEKDLCNVCLDKTTSKGKAKAQLNTTKEKKTEKDSCSLPDIQKPYSFSRTKINFTLEDLENSRDEDDDYSY